MCVNHSDTPGFSGVVYGKYAQSQKQSSGTEQQKEHHINNPLPHITEAIKEGSKLRLLLKLDEWHGQYMSKNEETPFSNLNELRWRDGEE